MTDSNIQKVTIPGVNNGGRFATAAALGNIDGSGISLAVTEPGYLSSTGRVDIFLPQSHWSNSTHYNASNADVTITGEEANNFFGNFLLMGKLIGDDELDDIIVAADGAGKVYVFAGKTDWSNSNLLASSADVIVTCSNSQIKFGFAMAVGNTISDWRNELIITAYGYSNNKGISWEIVGRVNWPPFLNVNNATNITQVIGAQNGDQTGVAAIAIDTKQNGFFSTAYGSPGALNGKGMVYIKPYDPDGSSKVINLFNRPSDIKAIFGEYDGGATGSSLATGNMQGGATNALIVGAQLANNFNGVTYLLFINDLSTDIYLNSLTMPLGLRIAGAGTGARCAYSLSVVKEFYGDHHDTLLTSCPFSSGGIGELFMIKAREIWLGDIDLNNPINDVYKISGTVVGDYFAKSLTSSPILDQYGFGSFFAGLPDSSNGIGMASVYFGYNATTSDSSSSSTGDMISSTADSSSSSTADGGASSSSSPSAWSITTTYVFPTLAAIAALFTIVLGVRTCKEKGVCCFKSPTTSIDLAPLMKAGAGAVVAAVPATASSAGFNTLKIIELPDDQQDPLIGSMEVAYDAVS